MAFRSVDFPQPGAEQHDELATGDLEVEILQDGQIAEGDAELRIETLAI